MMRVKGVFHVSLKKNSFLTGDFFREADEIKVFIAHNMYREEIKDVGVIEGTNLGYVETDKMLHIIPQSMLECKLVEE